MLILIKEEKNIGDCRELISYLKENNYKYRAWNSENNFQIKILKNYKIDKEELYKFDCVKRVTSYSLKLKNIGSQNPKKIIKIKGQEISQDSFHIIGGPCTIKNYKTLAANVREIKKLNCKFFRAGAYKLRTSPYTFEGLEGKGREYIKKISDEFNMISVSEITCSEDIDEMAKYVDILLVGTRNMFNYRLLKKLGKLDKPIILKRNFSATFEEWFYAAEHIANEGNDNIILCERGVRTFGGYTRNTLDISAIQAAKNETNLPIIVDPSHSTGKRELVESVSRGSIAAGVNGLLVEVDIEPETSIVDSKQTIDFKTLKRIKNFSKKFREIFENNGEI